MLQHFYDNHVTMLCCERADMQKRIAGMGGEDMKEIRKLPSIAKYIEKVDKEKPSEEDLARDDEKLKKLILTLLEQFHDSMSGFFTILKCLHSLTSVLPGSPLGKQVNKKKQEKKTKITMKKIVLNFAAQVL